MNLTTSDSKSSTWKSFKAQYIAAVCGLTIAIGALTAIGTWRDSSASVAGFPARASISSPQAAQAPNQFVVFIAGSQQQASDHAAQIYQDLNPAWFGSYSFVVVTNAEEEAQALSFLGGVAMELVDVGTQFQVVDLRAP